MRLRLRLLKSRTRVPLRRPGRALVRERDFTKPFLRLPRWAIATPVSRQVLRLRIATLTIPVRATRWRLAPLSFTRERRLHFGALRRAAIFAAPPPPLRRTLTSSHEK